MSKSLKPLVAAEIAAVPVYPHPKPVQQQYANYVLHKQAIRGLSPRRNNLSGSRRASLRYV